MVLESLINPEKRIDNPRKMVLCGFIYSSIGIILSLWIFKSDASLPQVFITVIPLIIIMYRTIKIEERKDMKIKGEKFLLKEHAHTLSFFMYLFMGLVLSYSFWVTFLPYESLMDGFGYQLKTIDVIRGGATMAVSKDAPLMQVLYNNYRVLGLCIMFSFLYGSGAIFILTWNASVIGVAVGNTMRRVIESYAHESQLKILMNYFISLPISMSYMVHGLPEIAAYFTGGLAGGIISFAIVNHHYRSREFKRVVVDSVDLMLVSILLLFLAGIIEVYITPVLF